MADPQPFGLSSKQQTTNSPSFPFWTWLGIDGGGSSCCFFLFTFLSHLCLFLLWKDLADGSISKSSCNKSLQYVFDPLSQCKKLTYWCMCVVSVLLWQDRSWARKLPRSPWASSPRARNIKSESTERSKQHRVWTMSHSHFLVSNTYHACAHWQTP